MEVQMETIFIMTRVVVEETSFSTQRQFCIRMLFEKMKNVSKVFAQMYIVLQQLGRVVRISKTQKEKKKPFMLYEHNMLVDTRSFIYYNYIIIIILYLYH
jgi:hypothetical protein